MAVEGEDEVTLVRVVLRIGSSCGLRKGALEVTQRLQIPGLRLPTQVSFSPSGKLWAAGQPPSEDAESRCIALGAAERAVVDSAAPAEVCSLFSKTLRCVC